jgi:hypothetical protein
MESKTMDVLVHKQALSLKNGESVRRFTQRLSEACIEHIMMKLNIAKEQGSAWMVEAFGDKVVVSAYKKDYIGEKYYAFSYSQNKEGKFEFGDSYEVERVVSFKPKSNVVSKSKLEEVEDEDIEMKACGGKTRKALGKPIEFGGWRETTKSFWQGVV